MAANAWHLRQIFDSAFPAGGMAHSAGLESLCHHGLIHSHETLEQSLRAALAQGAAASLPMVAAAWREPEKMAQWCQWTDAMTSNHIARQASVLQGGALLNSARSIFALPALEAAGALKVPFHLAPVQGLVAVALQANEQEACEWSLYSLLRSLVSALVRLGLVGPLEAQAVQVQMAGEAQRLLERFAPMPANGGLVVNPLVDLVQQRHDLLYSRLFQS